MAKGVVSSRPKDMISQGLINDVDVLVQDARWAVFDYGGAVERFCAKLTLAVIRPDGSIEPETHVQYFSAGKIGDWLPDAGDDDFTPMAAGSATALNNSTNWATLVNSMVGEGVPEDKFADSDMRELIGLRMHVMRKPMPKRQGMDSAKDEQFCLVCTKLIALPGEAVKPATTAATAAGRGRTAKPAAAPAAAATTTTAPAPPPASTNGDAEAVDAYVRSTLAELLQAAEGATLPAMQLVARFNVKLSKDKSDPAERKPYAEAVKAGIGSEEWLLERGMVLGNNGQTTVISYAG